MTNEFTKYSNLLEAEFKSRGYETVRHSAKRFMVAGLEFMGPAAVTPEAVDICKDKQLTKEYAASVIDSPKGYVIRRGMPVTRELPFPLVVKPVDGSLAKGVFVKLEDEEEFFSAIQHVHKIGHDALVEEYIEGTKYRILASRWSHISNIRYKDSILIGNGRDRIETLVENRNRKRQDGDSLIKIDKNALAKQKLTERTILHEGRRIYLSYIAARATGAACIEEGDIEGFDLASRVIQTIPTLVTAGVDMIKTDGGWKLLECNAHSYLRQHLKPDIGAAQPVIERIVDAYLKTV